MSITILLQDDNIDNAYEKLRGQIEEESLACLLTYDDDGKLPLHVACSNPDITPRIIKLLIKSCPESVKMPNQRGDGGGGNLAIHYICENHHLDEALSVDILNILIEIYPESVGHKGEMDMIPIHIAARMKMFPSLEFFEILIDASPSSIMTKDIFGLTAIHHLCSNINCREVDQKTDILKYLLMKDPLGASRDIEHRYFPLHLSCSRLGGVDLTEVRILFDAYPEAILLKDESGKSPLEYLQAKRMIRHLDLIGAATFQRVVAFLETQLAYANESLTNSAMTTPDQNGWLPLHHALKDNAPLGSIKLLIKGNTSAMRVSDNNGTVPLHTACEFSSVEVVQYLMEMLDESDWSHLDTNRNSILHYACRGGNYEVVKYLFAKQGQLVSKYNEDEKLPIQLLCESTLSSEDLDSEPEDLDEDSEDLEHVNTIFQLLQAYPETVRDFTAN